MLRGKVNAELVLRWDCAPLVARVPRVSFIAAADDAVVADDVVFLCVGRNNRKLTNLTLVCHLDLLQSTFDSRP